MFILQKKRKEKCIFVLIMWSVNVAKKAQKWLQGKEEEKGKGKKKNQSNHVCV